MSYPVRKKWSMTVYNYTNSAAPCRAASTVKAGQSYDWLSSFGNVLENAFFGTYFSSLNGIIDKSFYIYASNPYVLIVPKLLNIVAALFILFFVVKHWLPTAEKTRTDLILSHAKKDLELRDASTLLRVASQVGRLGGWRFDLASSQVDWSDETAKIIELPDSKGMAFNLTGQFYQPDHYRQIQNLIETCQKTGLAFDDVLPIITAKGKHIWVRIMGEAERTVDGTICAVRGALQDISEVIAAQKRSEDLSQRLVDTVENISDAFFTLDSEGMFTFVNGHAETMFGRTRSQLLGQTFSREFPENEATEMLAQMSHARQFQQTARFSEYDQSLKKWLQGTIYPTADGLAVYVQDITDQQEKKEQLRLLESAVSRQNDILVITEAGTSNDPDWPRIAYVNDTFVRKTGFTREEAIGKSPRILQGPKTQSEELERIQAARELRQPVRAELINYTKAGEEYWVEVDIMPLADDRGVITHFVGIERDITRRKKDLEHIFINEERFRLIAKATNNIIRDWDFQTQQMWWNDVIHEKYGYAALSTLSGPASWMDKIHPDDRDWVVDSVNHAIGSANSDWTEEYRFLHADGRISTVIDKGFIIRSKDGAGLRMLMSMVDVTEHRQLNERLNQSQKLEAIGQLTGGIAHDFNNLLTVIIGNAEILASVAGNNPTVKLCTDMMMSAAESGAELTNRLLAFARRQPLQAKIVDVSHAIKNMNALIRRTLNADIEIDIFTQETACFALVDPGQLESAILNLAINSRDAMPDGGKLTIETENIVLDQDYAQHDYEVVPGAYVRVRVTDTGTGMTSEVAAQAFDPFFTTKEIGKGSGLGLSMIHGFIKQSGGHIHIETTLNAGTCVNLYLPSGETDPNYVYTKTNYPLLIGGTEHVLVVEDDALVRDYVVRQLQDLGYRVTSSSTGAEALEIILKHADIDLLFTDIIMPGGVNGRQLATRAKYLRPQLKILFTSGYSEDTVLYSGRFDTEMNLISKPYRKHDLAAKVRQVLNQ
eukprot:gene15162-15304_t